MVLVLLPERRREAAAQRLGAREEGVLQDALHALGAAGWVRVQEHGQEVLRGDNGHVITDT